VLEVGAADEHPTPVLVASEAARREEVVDALSGRSEEGGCLFDT
jgi:hypothetical protein